ncbi:hypothetical protein ACFLQ1_01040 [Candidatus Auribacterota bacterium]
MKKLFFLFILFFMATPLGATTMLAPKTSLPSLDHLAKKEIKTILSLISETREKQLKETKESTTEKTEPPARTITDTFPIYLNILRYFTQKDYRSGYDAPVPPVAPVFPVRKVDHDLYHLDFPGLLRPKKTEVKKETAKKLERDEFIPSDALILLTQLNQEIESFFSSLKGVEIKKRISIWKEAVTILNQELETKRTHNSYQILSYIELREDKKIARTFLLNLIQRLESRLNLNPTLSHDQQIKQAA